MINQYLQEIFYHYVLSDVMLAEKFDPDLFDGKNLQTCFFYAKDYVMKYHTAPTCEQLKDVIKMQGKEDEIDMGIIDVLYGSAGALSQYSKDWLYETVTAWAQWKNFIKSLEGTISYVKLNQDKVNVENVREIMETAKASFNKSCIIEFSDDTGMGSDFWDAGSHKRKKLIRSKSGYPFLDQCMAGGYFPGCLICFAGAPKIGKSLWLQNLCAKSVLNGENNCYISLELPEEMIHSRIGANIFNIPALDYDKYTEDVDAFKDVMTNFKKTCIKKPGNLTVKSFPTSTMSVLDLEAYLLKKEEELSTEGCKFKFKNIFVDYINIMRNYRNPNTENTYMKIKQLAEDLKAMGIKHDWAIITATQTNREQYDSSDILGSQIAESTGLSATVDVMFGIISDTFMKAEGTYFIKVLYDRVAPEDNKRKKFILDRNILRITEDPDSEIVEVTSAVYENRYPGHGKKGQQTAYQPQAASPQPQQAQISPGAVTQSSTSPVFVNELEGALQPVQAVPQTGNMISKGLIKVTGMDVIGNL